MEVFQDLCCRWGVLDDDLLASRFNNNLSKFASRTRDPLSIAVDTHHSTGSVQANLYLPSCEAPPSYAPQDQDRGCSGVTHCTKLVQADVVFQHHQPSSRLFVGFSRLSRSLVLRSGLPPCFTVAGFNVIAAKAQGLRNWGLSELLMPMRSKTMNSRSTIALKCIL